MLRIIVSAIFIFYLRSTAAKKSGDSIDGPCEFRNTVNISGGFLDKNGDFNHDGTVYVNGSFAEFDYILENFTKKVTVEKHIRGCICKYKTCIRICCRGDPRNCEQPNFFNVFAKEGNDETIDLSGKKYGFLTSIPCDVMYSLVPQDYDYDQWYFLNGSVHIVEDNKSFNYNDYCFSLTNPNGKLTGEVEVSICYQGPTNDLRTSIYPIGMLFSLPFLLATFCVYGYFSELRNLHGKSLMCFVLGLMIMYTFLIIVQLEGQSFEIKKFACVFCGYMIYIGVLLSFFWMNVMCYDIWSTFSETRVRVNDFQRFLFYCLYGFGVPFLIVITAAVLDSISFGSTSLKPMIGIERCWIQSDRVAEAIYTYLPISSILVINIVLCSITAFKIFRSQQRTSTVRSKRQNAEKERFFLYLRLFIVMGATWTMESISWFVEHPYFFYFTDILNCLQGFFIFVLFVWKPKIKELICQRYRSIRKQPSMSSHSQTQTTET